MLGPTIQRGVKQPPHQLLGKVLGVRFEGENMHPFSALPSQWPLRLGLVGTV